MDDDICIFRCVHNRNYKNGCKALRERYEECSRWGCPFYKSSTEYRFDPKLGAIKKEEN